jgi:hypothetical protein
MTKRVLTAAATLVALLAMGGTAQAANYFSPTGPWNAPVPANPPLEPNSTQMVSYITSVIAQKTAEGGGRPYINTTSYSTPVYRVGPSTPKQPIKIEPGDKTHQQVLQNAINLNGGVPFPAGAEPAPGTDGHIVVYDDTSKKLYEFWHASSPSMNNLTCTTLPWKNLQPCYRDSKWHADWGGIMDQTDTDPGWFSNQSWSGIPQDQGWNWGATATSLPLLGGLITFDDLNSGVIRHALAGAFYNSCGAYWVAPAQRHDGNDTNANCLPEGTKLQLDPSYNVDADSNPPLTKAVERAAQTYGIIVRDNTGGSFGFYGEQPITTPPNPYREGPGVGGVDNGNKGYFGGLEAWQLFENFPWSRLRVVQSTHCSVKGPCP